ncbi:MAG: hypothetical protein IJX88_05980, partial [Clostridia bacterium]|nr:hypothetical protein [Clostridia bacterium]
SICLKTWPTPPSYVIFGREYRFCDCLGKTLANASSRWCLIDIQSGKILSSKVIEGQDYSTYNTSKTLENVQWKIPTFTCTGTPRFTITVANSEYDHNMHVNNTRYAEYCFNVFTVKELAQKTLKRFSVSYIKQCFEGETLSFYREKRADGIYLVQGINERNETVVMAEIVFGE